MDGMCAAAVRVSLRRSWYSTHTHTHTQCLSLSYYVWGGEEQQGENNDHHIHIKEDDAEMQAAHISLDHFLSYKLHRCRPARSCDVYAHTVLFLIPKLLKWH